MKFFKRRELTQDEKCERSRSSSWHDEHMWSEWRDWWRLGGISVRNCKNCGAEEIRHADPEYLKRLNNKASKDK